MPFRDFREFITKLETEGEAQRIEEEVDWNLEAGAILRRSAEAGLPAPFFQKVKGYPEGYRLLGGPLASYKRVAIAMDMEPNTAVNKLTEEFLRRRRQPIKPVFVKDGPCKENVHIGSEVDLLEFPVPMVHDGDGGRYIGTWHLTIAKDLNSDWVNWGMHRHLLYDKNSLGIYADPYKHIRQMYSQSYEPGEKTMEVAIAIGVEPVSAMCASSPFPYGVSEVDIAGGIRGEPVELVKCQTLDLSVPATAEIVIEGEMRPGERRNEGPFGEFTGYRVAKGPMPIIHVKAVTHRNNPILTMSCMGVPVDDSHIILSMAREAEFLEALRARGLPVTGICVPPEASSLLVIVAVKVPYANVADDIAHVIWATKAGRPVSYLIVVDEDVDPFNMAQVVHALVTKCHPNRGIVKLKRTIAMALSPWANEQEQKYRAGAKVYFDCTWPLDWDPLKIPKRISFAEAYPLEVQEKALTMWHKYGY